MAAIATADFMSVKDTIPRISGLTPTARLLLAELLSYANKRTGTCWPSETRLAEALHVTVRTIQRAKVQLRDLGIIMWTQCGRHRSRTPLYRFVWPTLISLAKEHARRVKEAAGRFPKRRLQGPSLNGQLVLQRAVRQAETVLGTTLVSPKPRKLDISLRRERTSQTPAQRISPTVLRNKAHQRLYRDLTSRLPERQLGNLIAAVTPSIEEQALTAEQKCWGSGAPLMVQLASETVVAA